MLRLYFVYARSEMSRGTTCRAPIFGTPGMGDSLEADFKFVQSLIRYSSLSSTAPYGGYVGVVSWANASDRRDKNDALRAKVVFSS
jgi:hypothetical protein